MAYDNDFVDWQMTPARGIGLGGLRFVGWCLRCCVLIAGIVLGGSAGLSGQIPQAYTHWYFGEYAGLRFTANGPERLLDGAMNTEEGCSTISDDEGNLLFYTNGVRIWNRRHELMPFGDGLHGNRSTTQSSLIVRLPGQADLYYVFTLDARIGERGLRYSVVDMRLSGGNGVVLESQKNVFVANRLAEKLTAIHHQNGRDIWIIVRRYPNDVCAYLLTADGLQTEPVVSKIGFVQPEGDRNTSGMEMKCSPDGRFLALITKSGMMELYRFDSETGRASDFRFFQAGRYSFEFSPSSRFMYLEKDGWLCQFDLSQPNIADSEIRVSDTTIFWEKERLVNGAYHVTEKKLSNFQLGPDGKIYVSTPNYNYLYAINHPDSLGHACGYEAEAVYLEREAQLGLPNMIASAFLNAKVSSEGECQGQLIHLEAEVYGYDSLLWDMDDPTQPGLRLQGQKVSHSYALPGSYDVRLLIYRQAFVDTVYHLLEIKEAMLDLGPDTLLCPEEQLTLRLPDASYQVARWSDGSTGTSLQVSEAGSYWLEAQSAAGCRARDTIQVSYLPALPPLRDTVLCDFEQVAIPLPDPQASHQWLNAAGQPVRISEPGIYQLFTQRAHCAELDTIRIGACPFAKANPIMTPNGDGANDVLYFPDLQRYSQCELIVFNRWGQLVYTAIDYQNQWQGHHENGSPLPEGTYFFLLRYLNLEGVPNHMTGAVTIIRGR